MVLIVIFTKIKINPQSLRNFSKSPGKSAGHGLGLDAS
jgi:hypothetical protein